ncbi:MAG TPA: glycosyltransferase [Anaerolineae bacterium]|nr:glycosyltransferase [Anaerolineae bacterium]
MRILWIPHTGWHIPQRAHLFCRALAERHEVHVTDWIADFETIRDYMSWRYIRNFRYRYRREGNIHIHGIPRFSPAIFSRFLRQMNYNIYQRYVQKIVDERQIDVVVGTFIAGPPTGVKIVLDIFDDNPAYWREFRGNEALAQEVQDSEALWAQKSDHIVTISTVLKDKFADKVAGTEITIIPNGVHIDRFKRADGQKIREAYGLGDKRVVGFVSSMGEFVGLQLYMEAIRALNRPEVMHFVVGDGPALPAARRYAEEHGLSNVKFAGWIKSEQVADYFAALDVGVIPFDLANFTHSAFPIKLVEYLACQIPVVSTPLEEIKRLAFPGVLLAEPEAGAFARGMAEALDMRLEAEHQLERYAHANLVAEYEAILEGLL